MRAVCLANPKGVTISDGFLSLWAVTNGGFSFWFYYAASAVPSFSFTMGNAYVADIMPGKYRATFFSFNSAVFSLVSIPAAAIARLVVELPHVVRLGLLVDELLDHDAHGPVQVAPPPR